MDTPILLVIVAILLVVSFWAGRKYAEFNSPLAEKARLTRIALDAVKRLNALKGPAKTPQQIADEAHEAAMIAELKAETQSVT